jgi:ubiquinone/menaquinone biosynthesis C-methylase UbiE
MKDAKIFDQWPDKYDAWFKTPIGRLILKYESELVFKMLAPSPGERILDAGCGSGIFSKGMISAGAEIFGLDLSLPMLTKSAEKHAGMSLFLSQGSMESLPFSNNVFNKTVSITAVEFIEDAKRAVAELFRVTRPGGIIVVATLNSSGPWAKRRKESGKKGHPIFKKVCFRSREEIAALSEVEGVIESGIHFKKEDSPENAERAEKVGREKSLETGAFLAARWQKPLL